MRPSAQLSQTLSKTFWQRFESFNCLADSFWAQLINIVACVQGDPIGRIFREFGSCLLWVHCGKLQNQSKYGDYFFHGRSHACINFDKKRVGLHFGWFFAQNSSGHPGPCAHSQSSPVIVCLHFSFHCYFLRAAQLLCRIINDKHQAAQKGGSSLMMEAGKVSCRG
jgi:hypothetical protein